MASDQGDPTDAVTEPAAMPNGSGRLSDSAYAADLSGQTHGDFTIIRRIGMGGMGQVYLAEQISLKRNVALKLLKPELIANPVALSRFQAEAKAVASITHPNIVQVYMVGEMAGMPFMALEYVQGITLREYITRKGPPDVPRALLIMRQVAAALQRASEQGIVHRDIKPENILLTRKGEVKVTDFGLSRLLSNEADNSLTQTGITMGTPLYMSPEQAQGKVVDPRSDIYSFGVTCYYLLGGRPPFTGSNAVEVALKHVSEQPRPLLHDRPDLPPELAQLVHRMIEKDPAARPQSGREILRELNAFRGQTGDSPFGELPASLAFRSSVNPLASTTGTQRVGSRFPWKFAAGALLAFFIGAAGRLAMGPPRSTANQPKVAPVEMSENERVLRMMVRDWATANPTDSEKLKTALRANVELAILFSDQHRKADAEALADQLAAKENNPSYQVLGKMLQAVNYSFDDDAAKSNATFQLAMADKSFDRTLSYLTSPPSSVTVDFRLLLVRALDRNDRSTRLPNDLMVFKAKSIAMLQGRPFLPTNNKKGP